MRSSDRQPKKQWTVMVYMAGDNNLDPNGVKDLKEMKRIGSTDDVNIVVQFDRSKNHASERYHISKGGKIEADVVAKLGTVNTGDPKFLSDFIKWGIGTYPAERYMVVLWNHGQGWDDTDIYAGERFRALRRLPSAPIKHALFHTPVRRMLRRASRDPQARAILLDDNAKDFLDNAEMKAVMAGASKLLKRNVDILGMDACLMSMIEVGYQVRGSVSYTVGSEQTEPLDGWPYHTILGALAKKPSMTPKEFSALIVDKYVKSYTRDAVTQSAVDLSRSETLAGAVRVLGATLKTSLNKPNVRLQLLGIRNQVQSYAVTDNVDLMDLCKLLVAAQLNPGISAAAQTVVEEIKSAYIVANGSKGKEMQNSNGVAIYFPTDSISPLYAGLDFCTRTGWDKFLLAYRKAVRSR